MSSPQPGPRLAPQSHLGPYQIVGPLGVGGMGEVYRARDTRLERYVAIKVLPSALAGDEQFRARFEREAKSISALAGGPAQTICDTPRGADGTWSPSGVILFDGRGGDPIWRVDASGGVARVEVGVDAGADARSVAWPEFLPDGRHFLYMSGPAQNDRTLMVRALDSTDAKPLFKTTSRVVFAPPGFLLYVRERTLVAQPFDLASLAITGEPIPIGEGLGVNSVGLASFSLSRTGVLAFRPGGGQGRRLIWMDRSGKETPALEEAGGYADTWLSPDVRRLVFDRAGDLWIRDFTRGVTSRFTFDAENEFTPVWSPDGRRIVFTKQLKVWDLYVKDAAGTGSRCDCSRARRTRSPPIGRATART